MASLDGVCVDELSVRDISVMLGSIPGDAVEIPERFKVKEALRPCIGRRHGLLPSADLPLVDLAPALSSEQGRRGDVVTALCSAAKEWGFFQVVNHGVPTELLDRMASLARDFFCLPTEQKQRGEVGFLDGYEGKSRMIKDVGCMWLEGITLKSILAEPLRVERFANRVWPQGGNPAFCETVCEVARELELLKNKILKLLAEGLGLPTDFFSWPFELEAAGQLNFGADVRVNYYPPCAQPSMALGTMAHTDPTLMTLLYQDTGNGLQILSKDGRNWHLVDYHRDGIIVFINDVLQGWSNGVLQAGIHRAVLNDDKGRISFLLSSSPPPDLLIQPASLPPVDGDARGCLPRYKPFRFRDYIAATSEFGHLPPENGRKGMDIYAGIPF